MDFEQNRDNRLQQLRCELTIQLHWSCQLGCRSRHRLSGHMQRLWIVHRGMESIFVSSRQEWWQQLGPVFLHHLQPNRCDQQQWC